MKNNHIIWFGRYEGYLRTCITDVTISIRKLPKGVGL